MPEPEATFQFETLLLERARFYARSEVSNQLLADAKVRTVADWMADRMVLSLEAEVLEDPNLRREINYVVEEQPIYDSWRHWIVATLPFESFRRRFLAYFWGIDPAYQGKRRIHELHIQRRGLFPENTMRYPDHLGPVHLPVAFEPRTYYRDA